jgi:hypothetical protein
MSSPTPLYMRVMGDSWSQLAEPLRRLHATRSTRRAHGAFRLEHGDRAIVRFLVWLLRLPPAAAAADTELTITPRAGGEHWERVFNGRRLATIQYQADTCTIAERFSVFELRFELRADGASLLYEQRDAAFFLGPVRVRIPARLAPRVDAREDPDGPTRIHVEVRVALPAVGPLITYVGTIEVVEMPS